MLNIFTVSFFGHRQVSNFGLIEQRLERTVRELLGEKEYIDFLVGRNGDFDQMASSTVIRLKKSLRDDNSSLILILPYMTSECANNRKSFEDYYDEIEVSGAAANAHFKAALQIRNREMVDRSDLVICCIERKQGGAYKTTSYARKNGKKVLNLADDSEWQTYFP